MKSKIFLGEVTHERFFPKKHYFKYRSYFFKLSLNELKKLENIFFKHNRFSLFSFYDRDHGLRKDEDLANFARLILEKNNVDSKFDDIIIHTIPRIVGHVFNPVSFWYLYKDQKCFGTIIEVNNTFGETHSYYLSSKQNQSQKILHVSPFNQIEGYYLFKFLNSEDKDLVQILYYSNDHQLKLMASISGTGFGFNIKNLLKTFILNPFFNLNILFLIHFEALRLFLKGIKFYGKNGKLISKS